MITYHKIQTVFKRDPETNFQTLLEGEFSIPEFEYLQHNQWVFTEKVDGTNIRIMQTDGQISFGGKTDKATIPEQLVERLSQRFLQPGSKFAEVFRDTDVCLYGEGYGPRIQKGGGNYRSDQDFVLFDVKIGKWWLQRSDVEEMALKLGVEVVPIIGEGSLADMVGMAKQGITSTWGDFAAEGIVARPTTELMGRNGKRIITKIKSIDFQ